MDRTTYREKMHVLYMVQAILADIPAERLLIAAEHAAATGTDPAPTQFRGPSAVHDDIILIRAAMAFQKAATPKEQAA